MSLAIQKERTLGSLVVRRPVMLTLFAIPKPFRGHIGLIQRNAIRSWTVLRPSCEIILFGDEDGTADVAREFGLHHVPDVARNEHGTPLLNSIFDQAQQKANHRLLAYVNADIILLDDFTSAVGRIPFRRFLLVGRRWDLNVTTALDFGCPDWVARLQESVGSQGLMQETTAIDYFVFTSGVWGEIPPFAIGRTYWDNWLIYRARAQRCKVIDASEAVMAVHQNHDYSHVQANNMTGVEAAWKGPEAQINFKLAGGNYSRAFSLEDATWTLPAKGVVRPGLSAERFRRHLLKLPVLALPRWRFHVMRLFFAVIVAWHDKRLMSTVIRGTKRLLAARS